MSEGDLGFIDTAVAEAPPVESPTPEAVEQPNEPTAQGLPEITPPEDQQRTDAQPPADAPKGDTAAREVSKMMRELREAHPERAQLLKQVQDAFFRASTYQSHYDTPEAAQRAKVTFEALGGDEGIAQLQEHSGLYQQMEDMASKGSPEMISSWREEYPDGFRKAAPVILSELEKMDARAFSETIRPHLVKSLASSGLTDAMQRIAYLAKQANNDMLTREVGSVQAWLDGMTQEEQQRQQQQNDPRNAQFDQRARELSTREASIRTQQITSEVQPYLTKTITDSLADYTKGKTLSEKASGDLRNAVLQEINSTLSADKVYQANLSALNGKGDVKAILKYIRSNVDAVKGRIAREVWARRSEPFRAAAPANSQPAPKNGQQPPAARQQQNAAPLRVPAKPNGTDIDWSKDPDRMLYITGKAHLRNGKFVQWR